MIKDYLEYKKHAWSPKTKQNVTQILSKYGADALKMSPAECYDSLSGLSPYSRKTVFIILTGWYGFHHKGQENIYDTFRKQNRYSFKGSYKRKAVQASYEAVESALQEAPPSQSKEIAFQLLKSAQRWTESRANNIKQSDSIRSGTDLSPNVRSAFITGKGDKQRLNLSEGGTAIVSYHSFRRWLHKTCGITPHSLRKLALSRAAERGATAADLCAIAGWASIAPAYFYLQPKDADRLKAFLK